MKKTVLVMCFSSSNGGMEHDAIKLARLLGGVMQVSLFCKQGSFIHQTQKGADKNFVLEPISFSSRTFSLSMLFQVRALLRKYDIDNVIFFGASELKTLYFAFLGFDINLLIRHGTTKSRPKTDWFHRLIYSRVNYHIALSRHLLANVKYIVPRTQESAYQIIYPSFRLNHNESESMQSGHKKTLQITHVGRVVTGKGQLDVLNACHLLYDRGIKFRLNILGELDDGDYASEVKKRVNQSAFSSQVHLPGHVTNVADYLAETDIFLFPSTGEGMPNAFIEAMHYNNVCIAYDNTVFPEFIEMGFYIHLVKNGDVKALAEKLLAVVMDIENEKLKSATNVALVQQYFQPERELAEWNSLLI